MVQVHSHSEGEVGASLCQGQNDELTEMIRDGPLVGGLPAARARAGIVEALSS